MARVVVIFAILSLIAGAMYWIAHQPMNHTDASVTLPVAPTPGAGDKAADAAPAPAPAPAAQADAPAATTPTAADATPPADAPGAPGLSLNATGAEASILGQQTTTTPRAAQTGLVVESVEAAGA